MGFWGEVAYKVGQSWLIKERYKDGFNDAIEGRGRRMSFLMADTVPETSKESYNKGYEDGLREREIRVFEKK